MPQLQGVAKAVEAGETAKSAKVVGREAANDQGAASGDRAAKAVGAGEVARVFRDQLAFAASSRPQSPSASGPFARSPPFRPQPVIRGRFHRLIPQLFAVGTRNQPQKVDTFVF